MNTPAHIIFSFAGLGRANAAVYTVPIAIGALVPDMTMMLFYAVMKVGGVPEAEIWNQHYFDPLWQGIFDITNSIPVYAALAVAGWVVSRKAMALFAASALIHCVLDFFVHHDDGHRHFFPLSDYRFQSPVSYWDPAHYGNIVGILEILLVIALSMWLWFAPQQAIHGTEKRYPWSLSPIRIAILITFGVYSGYLVFVITYWVGMD